ncbi:MAG: endonuclease/exonuclease/phosphatase family protein [Clostridiales bacterium]|nr:endonuclease/exonuclease/phosphatase family protein [Clostridiales bacterium]
MHLKIATFNIGCGVPMDWKGNGDFDIVSFLGNLIRNENIDILALEESPVKDEKNAGLAELTGQTCGYEYYQELPLSPSHILPGKTMGVGIVSKYAFAKIETMILPNPEITYNKNGKILVSHNKGFLMTEIMVGDQRIHFITGHCFPFHSFKADEENFVFHFRTLEKYLCDLEEGAQDPILIAGDFNSSKLERVMPKLYQQYHSVLSGETRPSGRSDDHIFVSNHCTVTKWKTADFGFDHYCCICEVEI